MDLFAKHVPADVILLDYQCTLVENHAGRRAWYDENFGRNYADWIKQEVYRKWLVELLKGKTVVLITARKTKWREATMKRISEVAPDLVLADVIFNETDLKPHEWKKVALEKYVFPKFGRPGVCAYLGLESNALTREMYAGQKIYSVRVPEQPPYWDALPKTEISL